MFVLTETIESYTTKVDESDDRQKLCVKAIELAAFQLDGEPDNDLRVTVSSFGSGRFTASVDRLYSPFGSRVLYQVEKTEEEEGL